MFEIMKEARFEAAHLVEGHKNPILGTPGKCSRLHGHSYKVRVVIRSPELLPVGFVADYYWVGSSLKELTDAWDHRYLNEIEPFAQPVYTGEGREGFNLVYNPTAENIAMIVFVHIDKELEELIEAGRAPIGAFVEYAECRETETSYARYYDPRRTD